MKYIIPILIACSHAKLTYKNWNITDGDYSGEYWGYVDEDGKLNGFGGYVSKDSKMSFTGIYENDFEKHGSWMEDDTIYMGDFYKGNYHGYGQTWSTLNIFKRGVFVNDTFEGSFKDYEKSRKYDDFGNHIGYLHQNLTFSTWTSDENWPGNYWGFQHKEGWVDYGYKYHGDGWSGPGGYVSQDRTLSFTGIWINGEVHVGSWLDSTGLYSGQYNIDGGASGWGEFWMPDGDHYSGEWYENQFSGSGTYTSTSDEWTGIYTGKFIEHEMTGYGTYVGTGEKEGHLYAGFYYEDLEHGYGEWTYPDGRIFKGTFKNGDEDEGEWFIPREGNEAFCMN